MATPLYFPSLPGQGYSVHKKPKMAANVAAHATGRESRAPTFVYPLWDFEVMFDGLDMRNPGRGALGSQTMQSLAGFFMQLQGKYGTFLYVDPTDSKVIGQPIGTGDGSTTSFPAVRSIGGFTEPVGAITQMNAVYFNGVAQTSGWSVPAAFPYMLTFATAPAAGVAITADFWFAFICRLSDDVAEFSEFMQQLNEVKTLPFQSVRRPNPPGASSGPGAIPGPFNPAHRGVTVDNTVNTFMAVQGSGQTGPATSSTVTFSCWFRLYSFSNDQILFGLSSAQGAPGDTLYCVIRADGHIDFRIGYSAFIFMVATSAPGVVSLGAWHHIYCATSGTGAIMYLDGVNMAPSISQINIPAYYGIAGQWFGIPNYEALSNSKIDLYDFWLDYAHYLDATHIPSFMSGGASVPLGAHGELPMSGTEPTYFFHDGVPGFLTNLGSGDQPALYGPMITYAPAPPPP